MQPTNNLIHVFSGENFEVAVWRVSEAAGHMALIRSKPGGGATVLKGVIECTAEQLVELARLSTLAQMLIEHLAQGNHFACWTDIPLNN